MKKIFILISLIIIQVSILDAKAFDYLSSKLDVDRANGFYKKGNYESAISLYESALSKNTNSYQIYNNLALAKYANGDKEEALNLIETAKNIIGTNAKKSERANLYYNSGILNAVSENYKKSIDDLVQSLSLNPKDDRAREAIEYSRKRLKEENNNKSSSGKDNEDKKDNSGNDDNKNDKNNNDNNNGNNNNNKDSNNNDNQNENQDEKNNPDNRNSLRDLEMEQLLNSLRNLRKDDDYKQERLGNGYNNEKDW